MDLTQVEILAFGAFRLDPATPALYEASKPVRLGSRALGILVALVQRAGSLVTKEELLSRVWPDTFVEEGNLRVHIAALRKVLGDGHSGARYIGNVPGRGYRFVAPVAALPAGARLEPEPRAQPAPPPTSDLPTSLVRIIGREQVVANLAEQLLAQRFVTIVAPGGMGKTTVALAVAERLSSTYANGVRFVDLAPLTDASLVSSALANALPVVGAAATRAAQIRSYLAERQMLLVLDNCEHVLEAVAVLAVELLAVAPGLQLLVTSRAPLNAPREFVSLLPSLAAPAMDPNDDDALSASAALDYPAVQLFVERARANAEAFELSDTEVRSVVEICSWLGGNPLAIELAASQAAVLGVRQLAERLDSRFALTMKGRRTAAPRQQTLSATLDWSYDTLSVDERAVLRRLSVFRGTFTLDAALAVAGARGQEPSLSGSKALEGIIGLTAKSLLAADVSDSITYRLLEVTREYARVKLRESGEAAFFERAHAEHLRDLFERAEPALRARSADEWLTAHRFWIDDVRSALDWAFSAQGDAAVGVALTVSTIPLLFQTFLVDEYRVHLETALQRVRAGSPPDLVAEVKLTVALGRLLLQALNVVPEVIALIERALAISEGLAAPERMHALWAMWYIEMGRGRNSVAIVMAEQLDEVARRLPDPSNTLYDRMMALPSFYLADYARCRKHAENVVPQAARDRRLTFTAVSHVQEQVSMHAALACTSWMEGCPERALQAMRHNIERALSIKHVTSHCHALTFAAIPIALWAGRSAEAKAYVNALLAEATRHSLGFWLAWGRAYEWVLTLEEERGRGVIPRHVPSSLSFGTLQADWLMTLSDAFIDDYALTRVQTGEVPWIEPEVTRRRGVLLLNAGEPEAESSAEALFTQAMDQAHGQGARAWELRSALDLAELWAARGQATRAARLLRPIVEAFAPASQTSDLVRARALLGKLK